MGKCHHRTCRSTLKLTRVKTMEMVRHLLLLPNIDCGDSNSSSKGYYSKVITINLQSFRTAIYIYTLAVAYQ
jgi:hypothetical protein